MTSERSPESSGAPKQCLAGCGFFAGAAFEGYCSKCHKALRGTPSLGSAVPSASPAPMEPLALGGAALTLPAPAVTSSSSSSSSSSLAAGGGASSAAPATAGPGVAGALPPLAPAAAGLGVSTAVPAPTHPSDDNGVKLPVRSPVNSAASMIPPSPALSAMSEPLVADDGTTQRNKGRCWNCKKKVGLTGFECRCGYVYCGVHRYADQHACTFDYKTHDRAVLTKNNQKVVGDKLEKV